MGRRPNQAVHVDSKKKGALSKKESAKNVLENILGGGDGGTKKKSPEATVAFLKMISGKAHTLSEAEVSELFKTMDLDDSGSITVDELQRSLEIHISEPRVKKDLLTMLCTADVSLDGTIDAEEFRQALLLGSQDEIEQMATKLHGMPPGDWVFRDTLVDFLETREEQKENCKSLPLTLLFFIIFFYLVVHHLEISIGFDLSSAISGDLQTEIIEDQYPDSLWAIVAQNAGTSRISRHNRVVGGLRLQRPAEEGEPQGRLCPYSKWDWFFDFLGAGGALEIKPIEVCYSPGTKSSWVHWPLEYDIAMERFAIGVNFNVSDDSNETNATKSVVSTTTTSTTADASASANVNACNAYANGSAINASANGTNGTNGTNACKAVANASNSSQGNFTPKSIVDATPQAGQFAGWRRLAERLRTGEDVELEDPEALFPGLDNILKDPKLRRQLRAGGSGAEEESSESFFADGGGIPESSRPTWASDDATRLQLTIFTYNPNANWYTFMKLNFQKRVSGSVKVKQIVESFKAQPVWMNMKKDLELGRASLMGLDAVFLMLFLFSAVSELGELIYMICHQGCRRGIKMYVSVWNAVDWMNIFMVITILVVYFHSNYVVSGLNQLRGRLPALDESRRYSIEELTNSTGDIGPYELLMEDIAEQGERVVMAYADLKWYISVFAFCSALKFFKAFRANPRLDVVTQTVVRASADLAHFLVVFFALLMAFVLVAHILFGSQVYQFNTSTESLNTCFLILLGYAFDDISAGMFESGKIAGVIWAWIFNLLMVLILLNMVLAIIFDVYADIKTEAGDAPSLLKQTMDVFADRRARKKKLKEIQKELDHDRALMEKTLLKVSVSMKEEGIEGGGTGLVMPIAEQPEEENRVRDFNEGEEPDPEAKPEQQDEPRAGTKESGDTTPSAAEAETMATKLMKSRWNEAKLLDALKVEGKHANKEVVTVDSLIEALDASESDKAIFKYIVLSALEHSKGKENAIKSMSLIDSIRLIGRIDSNIRDILSLWRPTNSITPRQKKELDAKEVISGPDVEARFCRIEDAVAGLTHKLQRTIGPAPPVPMAPLPPPSIPVNESSQAVAVQELKSSLGEGLGDAMEILRQEMDLLSSPKKVEQLAIEEIRV